MRIKASYTKRTGFSSDYEPETVHILAFVEATFEPGYQRSGTKRSTVAVIVDGHGRLTTAELSELTVSEQT